MDNMELENPVMALAMLTQKIAGLEKDAAANKDELGECLKQRGVLLMQLGDKAGAEADMKRFLELNPEMMGEMNGEFKAEGRERCR